MISQKVTQFAQDNGYRFHVNGLGYRKLAEITDINGNHISWTPNTSKTALQSINALIKQKQLDEKPSEEIVIDAWEARRAFRQVDASDFAPTYQPRDNFGDDTFSMSDRYGQGALI